MNILVTGSTGFVGSRLCCSLEDLGTFSVSRGRRESESGKKLSDKSMFALPDLSDDSPDFPEFHFDTVIHTAGLAEAPDEMEDTLTILRRANVNGTVRLAEHAARQGVKRFVFVSSVKVNGESTTKGSFFCHDDRPAPEDAYGISKAEAEAALQEISRKSGMELVIIRPPLIYGPGVKGNFASLLGLVRKGIPLPLGAVKNERSLVALDNLVDLIVSCAVHPKAAGQVFLASDGKPVSTAELLRGIATAMNKRCWLFPVPEFFFRAGLELLGKKTIADRLFGSLVVDISHTKETLDWEPPISLEEGLRRAIAPS